MLHKPHRPRYIRLSAEHCRALLGEGAVLEPWMVISGGRFVAKQRLAMIGPKGRIDGVAIVGPAADETEVSLADQDDERLGVSEAPSRGVILVGPAGEAKVAAPE